MKRSIRHLFYLFFILAFALIPINASDDDDSDDDIEDPEPWVKNGGFVVLIIGMVVMFWALAAVCEDFFVPSLNVFNFS